MRPDIYDVVVRLPGIDLEDLEEVLASGVRLATWDEPCPGRYNLPPRHRMPVGVEVGQYAGMLQYRDHEPDVLWMSDIRIVRPHRQRPGSRPMLDVPSDAHIRRRLLVVLPRHILERYYPVYTNQQRLPGLPTNRRVK